MKRILAYAILLASVIQIRTIEAGAQATGDSPALNPSLYREKLYLFTDRNLYASGEQVRFRLYNLSHPLLKENNWSRVCYVELINSRNTAVARCKYRVYSWGGDGGIILPDTVSTGQYYLRAYTSWMRNFPPSGYFQLPLAIVNPRKISSADLSSRVKGTGSGSGEGVPARGAGIACAPDKTSYGNREKVIIRIDPESRGSSPDGYCISVIKKGYLDEAFRYTAQPAGGEPLRLKDLTHYPETRGATVSGTVLLGEGQEPAGRTLLGMTLLGPERDYFEFRTDEKGRFLILVPWLTGNKDALITVHPDRDGPVKVLLDDVFSSEFSTAPVPAVDFFGERRALVEDILLNSQLRAAFKLPEKVAAEAGEPASEYLFYGSPGYSYRTVDYVTLPDLEEFLFEIVPQVRVDEHGESKQLVVLDDRDEILYAPPMILLDYVPVPELGNLLSVSPLMIDHVDVVNRIYVRGAITYGGIVSFISRRGDRAGTGIPAGSAFISFSGLSEPQETGSPDYEEALPGQGMPGQGMPGQGMPDQGMPDLRTTLYWAARYEVTPENGGSFAFYTSDETGEYTVMVRGMTSDGKILTGSCKFTVK
jgi:hypothetical protein